jgi:hypothetical protein
VNIVDTLKAEQKWHLSKAAAYGKAIEALVSDSKPAKQVSKRAPTSAATKRKLSLAAKARWAKAKKEKRNKL